jgi:hypothetical protein
MVNLPGGFIFVSEAEMQKLVDERGKQIADQLVKEKRATNQKKRKAKIRRRTKWGKR